jgi:predicted extracellular nuclease
VAGKFTAKKAADDGSDPGLDGFYIAQGSGANQGIQLVTDSASVDLSVGEVVDVWGEYMEFYCHSQFRATKVESTGTSDAPAAATVTAAQLTDPAVAETFEGSLVRLESVEVLAVDQYEYTVTGGISVGGKFKPGYFANVGDSFDAIVGILDYSFSSYKIQPRTATDLEGLTEAPAKEMTISAIQQDASSTDCSSDGPQTTQQKLMTTGTVVSPVADISKNYNGVYVSDGDGAAWNGIFVLFEKTIEVTLAVGDTVNLSGDITEYYCLTEFMASAIEVTGSTTTPAPLVTTTADVLLDSEQWEGTYLTVEGLTVTNVDNATLPGSAGCDADGATCYGEFVVNDDFIIAMHDFGLDYTPEVGTSIASITGALKYSFGAYKLSPFSNADIVE